MTDKTENNFFNLYEKIDYPVGYNNLDYVSKSVVDNVKTRKLLKTDNFTGKPFYTLLEFSNISNDDNSYVCGRNYTTFNNIPEEKKLKPPFLDTLYIDLLRKDISTSETVSCNLKNK